MMPRYNVSDTTLNLIWSTELQPFIIRNYKAFKYNIGSLFQVSDAHVDGARTWSSGARLTKT